MVWFLKIPIDRFSIYNVHVFKHDNNIKTKGKLEFVILWLTEFRKQWGPRPDGSKCKLHRRKVVIVWYSIYIIELKDDN